MIKVLQISVGAHFGGIEKLELEYAKHLNSNNFKVDILVLNKSTYEKYEENAEQKYRIHNLNMESFNRKNQWGYDYRLYKFLKNNKYDIVHINSAVFIYSFRVVLISKLCGVKKIVVHSHNSLYLNPLKRAIKTVLNPVYRSLVSDYLACSKLAEKSLFTEGFIKKNKIKILKNGVEIEKFKFNELYRKKYRTELGLEGKIVYGHIGRFSPQKNHDKLIDIFYNIQKQQENSVLLLIGDGELKSQIEDKVKELEIQEKVKFIGFREDVNKILNAIDYFILPSKYEGLPVVLVEAQTNGIPVFCSDTISKEAKISDDFYTINLDEDCETIANKICNCKCGETDRKNAYKNVIENGYDIEDVCKELKSIYFKIK